jgi:hypothetical protein
MAETAELEAKVVKAVEAARLAIAKLMQELRPLAASVRLGEVDGDLAMKLQKRVKAVMTRFGPVTRLNAAPVLAALSEKAQAQVVWLSELMTRLLKLADQAAAARKKAKLYVNRKWRLHLKAAREALRATPRPPLKIKAMLKKAEKARDDFEDADLVPYVPISLLLMTLWDTIFRGLKTQPR